MYPQNAFAGMIPPQFAALVIVLIIWTIFWKGLALWHSARRGDAIWFVVFMFINTAGILELIYLFAVAKKNFNELFSK